jgi:hypothetical protein
MSMIKTARIRLSEMYQDSINFVKTSYDNVGQHFSMASPMGQILQVVLNLGRMILYYIEDSITELNINTASRPQSIRGLASLTGHNASRGQAARGTLRLTYNGEPLDIYANTVVIPNYAKIISTINGLTYTVTLPSQEIRLNLDSPNSFIDVNIVQGTLEYQQGTGTGDPLQSFNFQSKKGAIIDNYFVNVYVDGNPWEKRESILDMVYQEESCMVKTGQSGGIDIFFGNGYQGKIPPLGSTILVEYLLTDGEEGNIRTPTSQKAENWRFQTKGYALNSQEIDLNKILKASILREVIFGSLSEPTYLTRLLAPHTSRSFTLANTNNYIYFLRKLNIFTIVDAIPGFATFEDIFALEKYNQARTKWENINSEYRRLVSRRGAESEEAQTKHDELQEAQKHVYFWQEKINEEKQDDNTVYLYLVPDVNKRIAANQNYYTCSIDAFKLTRDEKRGILDLIEESGQRILTVDNAILDLRYPRFVLNVTLIIYEGYEFNTIREVIISKTSDYFLKNTRRDRIPASDIVRIIEHVDGVDSVTVWFDASSDNSDIYGENTYGIDSYGDILLERYVEDAFGQRVPVRDLYPLIRGGWESSNGVYYDDSIAKGKLSNVNINLRGITPVDLNSNMNKNIVSNL